MATTKINTPELFELESSTSGVRLPSGTTAQRPSTNLNAGDFRFNTDDNKVEYYDGSNWFQIDDEALPPVPSENFNAVLYAGNGGTQSITGVGFKPDFVWIKERNGTEWHNLFDSVRGADKSLYSNETSIEATSSTKLTSFDTDGFSLGSDNNVNKDSSSYIAWCFKGGGASVSNTQGDIGSDVSANQNTGTSIVKYTGNNLYGQTVGHGLGVAPKLVIIKNRSNARNWRTYAEPLGATKYINLDESAIAGTYGSFNDTPPTIDVFSTTSAGAADRATNYANDNYVAYCFADVAGYQKIGSYTGTGLDLGEGPIVNTGFEPAFVLIKRTNGGANSWAILDNKRSPTNPRDKELYANLSDDDSTFAAVDFLTNGFQIITTANGYNAGGSNYIYLAIASDPTSTTPSLTNSFKTNLYTGNDSSQAVGGHLNGSALMIGNGSITLPSSTSFDGTSNLSFSLWVFRQNTNRTFIMDKGQGGSGSYGWQLDWQTASAGFVFQMHNTGNTNVDVRTGAIANNERTWEHVVVTFNPSTFEAKIYYNGILCDTGTHSGTVSSNSGDVTIGTYSLATGFELTGSIDQFRFFNTVLTASQVSELYNETSSTANTLNFPTGAGCFAAYTFDTNADDLSGSHDASSVTNVTFNGTIGFNPVWTWIKRRSNIEDHAWFDAVRGVQRQISSNLPSAAYTTTNAVSAFYDDGWNTGDNGATNRSPETYVTWNWKASQLSSISTETADLASIINPNVNAGFSIARWVGQEQAGQTVAHGLGGTPELAFIKQLDGGRDWTVPLFTRTSGNYLYLNSSQQEANDTSNWSAVTSTLMTVGASPYTNGAGSPTIGYFFRSIAGYSSIGTYSWTGTSYTAGTMVTGLGFTPKLVIIKRLNGTGNWYIFDNIRVSGTQSYALYPDTNDAEATSGFQGIILNADGFSAGAGADGNVTGSDGLNLNGGLYLYYASAG